MEQMKKKKVFLTGMFLLLLSLIFSIMLPYYIPYNYPYYTRSEEWKEMIYEKQEESKQIPETLLKGQPTGVLFESVLNSPYFINLIAHGFDYKRGYESFRFSCDGLKELESREDVIESFMEVYRDYPVVEPTKENVVVYGRLLDIEMIIAQDEYVGRMSEEELVQFSELAAEKYYEKIKMGYGRSTSLRLYSTLDNGSYADKIIPPDFSDLPK